MLTIWFMIGWTIPSFLHHLKKCWSKCAGAEKLKTAVICLIVAECTLCKTWSASKCDNSRLILKLAFCDQYRWIFIPMFWNGSVFFSESLRRPFCLFGTGLPPCESGNLPACESGAEWGFSGAAMLLALHAGRIVRRKERMWWFLGWGQGIIW